MPPTSYDYYKKQSAELPDLKKSGEPNSAMLTKHHEVTTHADREIHSANPNTRKPRRPEEETKFEESKMSIDSKTTTTSKQSKPAADQPAREQEANNTEKVLITGDDILIEYVDRLIQQLQGLSSEAYLSEFQRNSIEKFITHYVWHCKDRRDGAEGALLAVRLESRLKEMLERRRRLVKYLFKKGNEFNLCLEGRLHEFEEKFVQSIQKKSQIIKKFSAA